MPVHCAKKNGKWRIVKSDGSIEKTDKGSPRDGGGHDTEDACKSQMKAINMHIKNEAGELTLFGEIGWHIFADTFIDELKSQSGDIIIRMNSRGGSLFESLAIYNAIDQYADKVTVVIEGSAISSASFIAMAADEVHMTEMSLFMLHDPLVTVGGTLAEVEAKLDLMKKAKDLLINAYSSKSKLERDEVSAMLTAETYFTAQEAKDKGFVDKVITSGKKVKLDISNSLDLPDRFSHLIEKEPEVSKILELAGKLGIDVQGKGEDDVVNLIIEKVPKEPKKEEEEKKDIPPLYVSLAKENREAKIMNLVREGKITKAVADDLRAGYCKDDYLKNVLATTGNDGFDTIIVALNKNEKVVSLGETTKLQCSLKAEDNPLIRDAERRAKLHAGVRN